MLNLYGSCTLYGQGNKLLLERFTLWSSKNRSVDWDNFAPADEYEIGGEIGASFGKAVGDAIAGVGIS